MASTGQTQKGSISEGVGLGGTKMFSHQAMSDSSAPWTAARQASPSFTISRGWLKPMSVESVMPSTHLILCRPFSWVGHVWVKGAAP